MIAAAAVVEMINKNVWMRHEPSYGPSSIFLERKHK